MKWLVAKRVSQIRILEAARVLRAGGLVVMPTETVYGLAADAFDPCAVRRVFELKGRPSFDPLIVHVLDTAQLVTVARAVPASVRRLIDAFWPGPLTLVLPRRAALPAGVTAGLATVAVRMPRHPVARRLLRAFGGPIAAPSANRFGRISPTSAAAVQKEFGADTPPVLDAGPCFHGVESTIVRPSRGGFEILRPGAVTDAQIARATGRRVWLRGPRPPTAHPEAPGLLRQHYAPSRPVRILRPGWRSSPPRFRGRDALLAFREGIECFPGVVRVLSRRGSLREAARNLYRLLRQLDESGARRIFVEEVPAGGVGSAINDRLRRAAGVGDRPGG
ncbi:MAG TPA: L-threonylcarbamoyladenylate synthase [Verrucomicrobiae bacterium]|nr:L-threonylcarbamoyladenylate synthase [Verrucomicrobiae bacterium]